jgi:iron complex outermembrane recepter protein
MAIFRERSALPRVASTALLAAVLHSTQNASAQQQTASTNAQSQSEPVNVLQEVVVTAERRTENLQRTAIAATVLNQEDLSKKGVVQMADLQNASPSLSITNAGLTANVNIRGIGLDSGSPSVVPGVATYRDGLWQPPIVTTGTLYDISSVEVLRGPQGTFVGSNSTGGAIFINTRNPGFDGVQGDVEVKVGNYSDWGLNGGINLPINDTWAARVAVDAEKRESFFRDTGSKLTPSPELFNHPGSLDEKNIRMGLRGKPTDNLDVLLKVDVEDKSTGGYAYRPVPGTTYAAFAPTDPFTLDYDQATQNDELAVRASLKVDWTLGDSGVLLRSLTGDQFMRVHNIYDIDATSSTLPGPPAMVNTQAIIERPVTQEFNLISPNTGRLQWILGAFYLHDIREVALDIKSQTIPQTIEPDFFFVIKSAAAFGQLSYELTPSLQLQAGLRYTHDSNSVPQSSNIRIILGIPGVPDIIVPAGGSETDSALTGKVALNWTVNDDNFLYAFVAKGAKAGGFNAAGPGNPQTNFAPEIVWDYELGWKGTFLDKHLRANLGGFWNNYTDLQVGALNPGTGQQSLVNAGKSTIKGVELELHGRFGGFGVDAGGAYVNSKLGALTLVNTEAIPPGTNQPQCTGGLTPPACFDYNPFLLNLSGSQNPFSPQWTFNAGAEYDFPVGHGGTFTPRLNYSYVGSQWTTLFELPQTDYLHSFGLWNATLTYEQNAWRVQAYGLNLANKLYVSGQSAAGTNPNNEFLGNPRQFGLRVSRRF